MITYNQIPPRHIRGGETRNVVARGPCGCQISLLSPLHYAFLCESFNPTHFHEKDLARRWYALPAGALLPLSNGNNYQLIFAGRPGGPQGPDIRDAILHPAIVGDVELHIHASDWFAHQHHRDPRYNNVILHVVLTLDDPTPTLRHDGTIIPSCSLQDISPMSSIAHAPHTTIPAITWPCEPILQEMSIAERTSLLRQAGLLRFEQKTHTFVEQLHNTHPPAYDTCLILALAEGLGYGRDRAFFRAAGRYFLGLAAAESTPEPLGHTPNPPPLDAQRLHILAKLISQWRTSSAWQTIRTTLISHPLVEAQSHPPDTSVGADLSCPPPMTNFHDQSRSNTFSMGLGKLHYQPLAQSTKRHGEGIVQTIASLRSIFSGLSTARSDILICNVVLPFAAAVALIEQDNLLFEQTQTLYEQYPSLSSNQVTRAMRKQLHLHHEPGGACQQQGLHYIYQQTCREKHCSTCIVGRSVL